jgi:hypothetical protein
MQNLKNKLIKQQIIISILFILFSVVFIFTFKYFFDTHVKKSETHKIDTYTSATKTKR